MDSRAMIAAIFAAAFGAGISYQVLSRRWLVAGASCAIGTTIVLGMVTEGNRSHREHQVVFATSMILLACFAVAAIAESKARRHDR